MSLQKFWEAGPEQFQRPRRKDTLVTTPRQHYPVGPWWDTLLCQGAGKACSALQEVGTRDKWMERCGHKSQQGKFPPGYGEHSSGGIPALGDPQHLPGQDMISLFQLWGLLGAGAGWEAPGVSPRPTSLTPEFLPAPRWEKGNSSPLCTQERPRQERQD